MEFKQIEAFVNVVRYRNFSRAADATFLSQPTISAHINNLENELGIILLNRQGKEVSLTSQGELFYPYAVSMLNAREQAKQTVQGMKNGVEGILEIQASSIPGQYLVPKLLGEYHKEFPNVKIILEQSDSHEVMENIINQKGEIGFTGTKRNNQLEYEQIYTDDMVLLTPNKGKFAEVVGDEVELKMLEDCDFILREAGSATKAELEKLQIKGESLLKRVKVVAHMNNMDAIRRAVAAGLGVSIVSGCAMGELEWCKDIRCFHIKGAEQSRHFYMVRHKNGVMSPAAEHFWKQVLMARDEGKIV